jgi:hypothetical protein
MNDYGIVVAVVVITQTSVVITINVIFSYSKRLECPSIY